MERGAASRAPNAPPCVVEADQAGGGRLSTGAVSEVPGRTVQKVGAADGNLSAHFERVVKDARRGRHVLSNAVAVAMDEVVVPHGSSRALRRSVLFF